MSRTDIIVLIVVIVVLGLVILALATATKRRRRQGALRERFGPEYERAVTQAGDVHQAQVDLEARSAERDQLPITELSTAQRDRFEQDWRDVQAKFVDLPNASLSQADALVSTVMAERGYPVEDFDRQADLVSVDHPEVVERYREAHRILLASQTAAISTEDMRQAFVSYRTLFTGLVREGASSSDG